MRDEGSAVLRRLIAWVAMMMTWTSAVAHHGLATNGSTDGFPDAWRTECAADLGTCSGERASWWRGDGDGGGGRMTNYDHRGVAGDYDDLGSDDDIGAGEDDVSDSEASMHCVCGGVLPSWPQPPSVLANAPRMPPLAG
jgi:hypothetical protein